MDPKSAATEPRSLRIAIPVVMAAVAVSVLWVRAGTLDPPGGPIVPTMHSLDAIYDGVVALDTSSTSGADSGSASLSNVEYCAAVGTEASAGSTIVATQTPTWMRFPG